MGMITVTRSLAERVYNLVGLGLPTGVGKRGRGTMCVQACVMAATQQEHGDQPAICVPADRINIGIWLNDEAGWTSNKKRGDGLRRYSVAQMGSSEAPEFEFIPLFIEKMYKDRFVALLTEEKMEQKYLDKAAKVTCNLEARTVLRQIRDAAKTTPRLEFARNFIESVGNREHAAAAYALYSAKGKAQWAPYKLKLKGLKQIAELAAETCIDMKTEGSVWLAEFEKREGSDLVEFLLEQKKIGDEQIKESRRAAALMRFVEKYVDDKRVDHVTQGGEYVEMPERICSNQEP